jgi:hypothetical protein
MALPIYQQSTAFTNDLVSGKLKAANNNPAWIGNIGNPGKQVAPPPPKNDPYTQPDQPGSGPAPTYNATDPYAKYGGKARYDQLVSGFDTQQQNIYGTSRDAAQNAALSRQGNILDFIQSLVSGQHSIDERGVQNELAKRQGTSSILDMVGRGIRQGGVMLAGKNASDSSAAEGIARAYGDIGQRELSKVGNQYELENRNIGLAQDDFNTQREAGVRRFGDDKTQVVNGIVTDARNKLAQLDAAMVDADVPTRVQIEQEKNAIKEEALGILSQYDQELSQGVAGVQATGTEDRRRTAADLSTRGVAATNPFDFTAQAPAQFAGTGPFATQLPLFLRRSRNQGA